MRVAGVAKASRNDTSDKATAPTNLTGGPKANQKCCKRSRQRCHKMLQLIVAATQCEAAELVEEKEKDGWKLDLLSGSLHSSSQSSATATPPPPPTSSPAAAFVLSNAKDATRRCRCCCCYCRCLHGVQHKLWCRTTCCCNNGRWDRHGATFWGRSCCRFAVFCF